MKERRIERRETHEIEREKDVAPRVTTTNVNVDPEGNAIPQEHDAVEDVGGELEDLSRPETIVERRTR